MDSVYIYQDGSNYDPSYVHVVRPRIFILSYLSLSSGFPEFRESSTISSCHFFARKLPKNAKPVLNARGNLEML